MSNGDPPHAAATTTAAAPTGPSDPPPFTPTIVVDQGKKPAAATATTATAAAATATAAAPPFTHTIVVDRGKKPAAATATTATAAAVAATAAAANQDVHNADAVDRGKKPAWKVPSSNGGSIDVGSALGSSSWPSLSDSTKSSSSSESLTSLAVRSVVSPSGPAALNPNCSEWRPRPRPKSRAPDFFHGGEYMRPNPQPYSGTHHRPGNNNKRNVQSHGVGNPAPQNNYGNWQWNSMNHSSYIPPPYMQPPPPPQQMPHQGVPQQMPHQGVPQQMHPHHGLPQQMHPHHGMPQQTPQHGVWPPFMRPHNPVMPAHYTSQYMPGVAPYMPQYMPGVAPYFVAGDAGPPPPLYYPWAPPPFVGHPAPFVPHPAPPAVASPRIDEKRIQLLKQVDYYFSSKNLIKDGHLICLMDREGWVNISLIADFPKVRAMNHDIPYILETLSNFSVVVEVKGDKIRKRHDWKEWLPAYFKYGSDSSVPSSARASAADNLAVRIQAIRLEGTSSSSQNVEKPNGEGERQHADEGNDEGNSEKKN